MEEELYMKSKYDYQRGFLDLRVRDAVRSLTWMRFMQKVIPTLAPLGDILVLTWYWYKPWECYHTDKWQEIKFEYEGKAENEEEFRTDAARIMDFFKGIFGDIQVSSSWEYRKMLCPDGEKRNINMPMGVYKMTTKYLNHEVNVVVYVSWLPVDCKVEIVPPAEEVRTIEQDYSAKVSCPVTS